MDLDSRLSIARRSAVFSTLANTIFALTKLIAGIVGNSYALIADAIESAADVVSSLIVWGGLRVSSRDADDQYPFGYGKAETLSAAVVGLIIVGAAVAIAIQAGREIATPHHAPEWYTLLVLALVVVTKEILYRVLRARGERAQSQAVAADAWHQRSDAITSLAAFIGIGVALIGGPDWAPADDWAALAASTLIFAGGAHILYRAAQGLMDRSPSREVVEAIRRAASEVDDVELIETLRVRSSGIGYFVDIHVQTRPTMSLRDAHALGGRVKRAIVERNATVLGVLVHMEPYEGHAPPEGTEAREM